MAVSTENPPRLNEKVLLRAWARLSVFDQTANHLKYSFVRRRHWVIWLTLISTLASIATSIYGDRNVAIGLAIISIVMPIAASYLMNDIIKFTGTTSWIKYRYIAEMMRMHIFLYRMNADIYATITPANKTDDELVKKLAEARSSIKFDDEIPPSESAPTDETVIRAYITRHRVNAPRGLRGWLRQLWARLNPPPPPRTDNPPTEIVDDGLRALTIEEYIDLRLEHQRRWYERNIRGDFERMKGSVRMAQGVLLVGSIISAVFGSNDILFVSIVAMMNAVAVALTTGSSVSMFGKTYSLFQIAENMLAEELLAWEALQDNDDLTQAGERGRAARELVKRVEAILLWEREEWYEMALQAQNIADNTILGELSRLTERAKQSREESPGSSTDSASGSGNQSNGNQNNGRSGGNPGASGRSGRNLPQ